MLDQLGIKWHADHIDEDKMNDILSNIQILPPVENSRKSGASKIRKSSGPARKKPLLQLNSKTGYVIKKWDSVVDVCSEFTYMSRANIGSCARGKRPTACGFKWKYANTDLPGEVWTDCKQEKFLRIQWSNLGRIKTAFGVSTTGLKDDGYYRVRCHKKQFKVHRIIAFEVYPEEYEKKKLECAEPQVDHIDHNPGNNRPGNLQWVTPRENRLNQRPKILKI